MEALSGASPEVRAVLEAALEERPISGPDALKLASVVGADLQALCATADALRARQAGDVVAYVVNRNINFTNVCIKHCTFCAFSRDHRSEAGYWLDTEEIVRRATEAHALGATEVCIQAGLAPKMDGWHYVKLLRALKAALPDLHVHAFSPEEVLYGATRARVSVADYLGELKAAGLGSLPGTSAEILDDTVRDRIARGRISTHQWVEVITTAHRLGLPTTSTMMFGHLETAEHQVNHLLLLRSIQEETHGFTEFVPLSFIHQEAPGWRLGTVQGLRAGPPEDEVLRVHALARVVLGSSFRNIQTSWVKQGLPMAQRLLACGANDLGGTLINESISTSAGASHGQWVRPADLRRAIREAGRVPAQRTTLYAVVRDYREGEPEMPEPLDRVQDPSVFGSYQELTASSEFRFNPHQEGP